MYMTMNHDIKSLFGWQYVSENHWYPDEEVAKRALRALKADKGAVLWLSDIHTISDKSTSSEVINTLTDISIGWDTWEDYDAGIAQVQYIYGLGNSKDVKKMKWHLARKIYLDYVTWEEK